LEDYGGSLSDTVKQQIQPAMDRVLAYLSLFGIQPCLAGNTAQATTAIAIEEYERLRPTAEQAYRLGDRRFLGIA
jgi:hydrogenase maturation protease